MVEASRESPTPPEMFALNEAKRAAWQAVRMREASRAFVTGHFALFICLMGTSLVVTHRVGTAAPFVAFALLFGYLACLFWAIRRIRGQRLKSLVKVTDLRDENLQKAATNPRKVVLYVFGIMVYQALCSRALTFFHLNMSINSILASLAIFPLMGIGCFVYRAVKYEFWEDFLFAMCIALAHTPIFLPPGPATLLSFLAPVFVVVGTASLYHRWEVWSRSLDDQASGQAGEEAAP